MEVRWWNIANQDISPSFSGSSTEKSADGTLQVKVPVSDIDYSTRLVP